MKRKKPEEIERETGTSAAIEDPFERARGEFGAQAVGEVALKIYQYDSETYRQAYVRQVHYDPEIHTAEWIRRECGPGSYVLRFTNLSGDKGYYSRVYHIAPDPREERAREAQRHAAALPSAVPGDAVRELLATLKEQNQLLLTAIINRAPPAPATDPTASPLLVEIVRGSQQLTQALLTAQLAARPDSSGQILSLVERVTQFVSDQHAETDGGWLGTLPRLARELLPTLKELALARQVPLPPPLASGEISPNAAEFVNTNPTDAVNQQLTGLLRTYSLRLAEFIQSGVPPERVADDILDEIPAKFWYLLDSLDPNQLLSLNPRLTPHHLYVEQVVTLLKKREGEQASEEEEGEDEAT